MQIGAVGAVLLMWSLIVEIGLLHRALLPPVGSVVTRIIEVSTTRVLWDALYSTTRSALVGLAISLAIGVPFGLLLGMSERLARTMRLLVDIGRSFPVVALLPVLVLILGATPRMKVVVVVLACTWPILLQSQDGARRLDPVIMDTVHSYRIPAWLRFRRVVLPSAGPYIATGVRIATAAAVLVSVAVEVLTSVHGIGRLIVTAQQGGAIDSTLSYIFFAGVLGVVLNGIVWAIEERLLAWNHRGVAA